MKDQTREKVRGEKEGARKNGVALMRKSGDGLVDADRVRAFALRQERIEASQIGARLASEHGLDELGVAVLALHAGRQEWRRLAGLCGRRRVAQLTVVTMLMMIKLTLIWAHF